MKIYVKIAASICLILLISTGLIAVFNFLKFEKTLSGLANSQIFVIGDDVQGTIESGLSLGLSLPFLQDTQRVIDRARQKNPRLRSVSVFELAGSGATIVFDTERDRVGQPAAPDWVRALAQGPKESWRAETREIFTLGLPLTNSFNKVVGAVVLSYDRSPFLALLHETLIELGKYWLGILASSIVITGFGAFFFFRSISRSMERMSGAAPAAAGEPPSPLESDFAEARERVVAALREVEQLEHDLDAVPARAHA